MYVLFTWMISLDMDPDKAISKLNPGMSDLKIMYNHIANKWPSLQSLSY